MISKERYRRGECQCLCISELSNNKSSSLRLKKSWMRRCWSSLLVIYRSSSPLASFTTSFFHASAGRDVNIRVWTITKHTCWKASLFLRRRWTSKSSSSANASKRRLYSHCSRDGSASSLTKWANSYFRNLLIPMTVAVMMSSILSKRKHRIITSLNWLKVRTRWIKASWTNT